MKILLILLLWIFQTTAVAETTYKRNEIAINILIFDAYLEAIELKRLPNQYKTISLIDDQWQQVASKNANSVSGIYYSSMDSVVLVNERYGFSIAFIPLFNSKNEIRWSCKIEGGGLFFNLFQPDTCNH